MDGRTLRQDKTENAALRPGEIMPTLRSRPYSRLQVFYAALFASCIAVPALAEVKLPVPAVDQSAVAQRGFFYVGGHHVGEPR
jgi:hypothetical protein